ncbi:MAG: hypothetical protein DLM64_03475 [Solirubrobacterales bacterium]|nr:MAG: hypothetical protein DLM64_03475 [Solirubrobacterales bacterium]
MAVAIAAVLLAETVTTAQHINDKAQNIAKNGKGINESTDSVIQLTRTNKLATSILHSAVPIHGALTGIVKTAGGINDEATSINNSASTILSTAGTINSTAGTINSTAHTIGGTASTINSTASTIAGTAGNILSTAGTIDSVAGSINGSALAINSTATGINGDAGSILGVARRINGDAGAINTNLDIAIGHVATIRGVTGGNGGPNGDNILGTATRILDNAACIDGEAKGGLGTNGDCHGTVLAALDKSAPRALRLPKNKIHAARDHSRSARAAAATAGATTAASPTSTTAPASAASSRGAPPVLAPLLQSPVVSGTLNALQRPLGAVQQILNHLFR